MVKVLTTPMRKIVVSKPHSQIKTKRWSQLPWTKALLVKRIPNLLAKVELANHAQRTWRNGAYFSQSACYRDYSVPDRRPHLKF